MSDLGNCISTIHDEPVPATTSGTFDCRDLNGKEPSRVTYCDRCANFLGMVGYFTPDGHAEVTP